MSIRLLNNIIYLGLLVLILAGVLTTPVKTATAMEFTSEAQLVQKLSNQLSGTTEPAVLGSTTSVPMFTRGFSYPIPELGNCNSQQECFDYCEMLENVEQCSMVSYMNGRMDSQQLRSTMAFVQYIRAGYLNSCSDMGECVALCDDESAKQECRQLALSLQSSSRVLGASDQSIGSYSDGVLDQCASLADCTYGSNAGMASEWARSSLLAAGLSPDGCGNTAECRQSYQQMFQSRSSNHGVGRVLNVPADIDPIIGPGDTDTDNPEPYEPGNYLGCVYNNIYTMPTVSSTPTPEEFEELNNRTSECEEDFSPTQESINNFTAIGENQVGSRIGSISECILSRQTNDNLLSCVSF